MDPHTLWEEQVVLNTEPPLQSLKDGVSDVCLIFTLIKSKTLECNIQKLWGTIYEQYTQKLLIMPLLILWLCPDSTPLFLFVAAYWLSPIFVWLFPLIMISYWQPKPLCLSCACLQAPKATILFKNIDFPRFSNPFWAVSVHTQNSFEAPQQITSTCSICIKALCCGNSFSL